MKIGAQDGPSAVLKMYYKKNCVVCAGGFRKMLYGKKPPLCHMCTGEY